MMCKYRAITIMDNEVTILMSRKQKNRNLATQINTISMSVVTLAIASFKMNENYWVGG